MALCEHLAWARPARLGEITLRPKSSPSPGRGHEQSTSGSSSRTRLGESLSPERDNASLKDKGPPPGRVPQVEPGRASNTVA